MYNQRLPSASVDNNTTLYLRAECCDITLQHKQLPEKVSVKFVHKCKDSRVRGEEKSEGIYFDLDGE